MFGIGNPQQDYDDPLRCSSPVNGKAILLHQIASPETNMNLSNQAKFETKQDADNNQDFDECNNQHHYEGPIVEWSHSVSLSIWNFFLNLIKLIWLIPLICSLLVPGMSILVFSVALSFDQLEPILPFVSDAGTLQPQAGFFSMLLDILAAFVFMNIILRYRQMRFYIEQSVTLHSSKRYVPHQFWLSLCFISTVVCATCIVGLIVAGNFRMNEWIVFHLSGATIFFVGIYVYGTIQTFVLWQMADYGIESKPITQIVILLFGWLTLIGCLIFSLLSILIGGSTFFDHQYRLQWTAHQPGYRWHLLSTGTEWFAINSFAAYNLCTSLRMKRFDWRQIFAR